MFIFFAAGMESTLNRILRILGVEQDSYRIVYDNDDSGPFTFFADEEIVDNVGEYLHGM